MKVALIGAGNNGGGHVRSLAAMDDVTVVGIADPVLERAQEMAAEVGGSAYADHHALLDKERPDTVWISSPCDLHADQTVDCAHVGAHVHCEKPMALTLGDCDRMIEAARDSGVKLMIGQSTRYSPGLVEAKRIYESGRCGNLVSAWSLRMSYFQAQPDVPWRIDGERSGGIVFEWEVHEIDFVCSIGGSVSDVYAKTAYSRRDAPNFLDHFSAVLTFENGGYGNLEASQSCTLSLSGRGFVGTEGTVEVKGRDEVRIRTIGQEKAEIVPVSPDPNAEQGLGRMAQNADFIRAIREDDVSPIPGEDGRANIEIGLAIIESGRTGEVVKLPMQPAHG